MKLLNGRELASYIKERQAKQVRGLRQAQHVQPKLAIVVTVDNPVIDVYMRMKQRYGADILIETEIHRIAQADAPATITQLNDDPSVHGIIVQLPLEDPSQTDEIVNLVAPEKDVDALGDPEAPWPPHLDGLQGAGEHRREAYQQYGEREAEPATQQDAKTGSEVAGFAGKQAAGVRGAWFEPATPMAILWLLSGYNIELQGKEVLLIGRGKLVGAPLERMLKNSGISVFVADSSTTDLAARAQAADIIITATGQAGILTSDMVKSGAVVVDAGTASEDGKTVGDIAAEVLQRDDITMTPAKGGVGPLTVCALFDNVIRAARLAAEKTA